MNLAAVQANATHPQFLAFLALAIPVLLGWLIGSAASYIRLARSAGWRAVLAALASVALAIGLLGVEGLSSPEIAFDATLFATSLWVAAIPVRGRERRLNHLVLVVAILLTLGMLELATRWLLPPVVGFRPPGQEKFFVAASEASKPCTVLYPDRYGVAQADQIFEQRVARKQRRNWRVLHLGDSMVEGVGVEPQQSFPGVLERLQPDVTHINGGFAGTGLDFHYLLLRRWLDRVPVDLVVLYSSHATEKRIDQLYSCCPGGPLLSFHQGVAWERCGDQAIGGRLAQLLTGPMPFALRVTASWSALARRFAALQYQLRLSLGGWMNQSLSVAERVRLLKLLVRQECERRNIPLLLWPMATPDHGTPRDFKPDLDYTEVTAGNYHVVERRDEIFEKLLSEGVERTLMPRPDAHFSPRGHELVAQFLAPQIRAMLEQHQR